MPSTITRPLRPQFRTISRCFNAIAIVAALGSTAACDDDSDTGDSETGEASSGDKLATRAYVVSERSDEVFVLDWASMTEVGRMSTTLHAGQVNANHMAQLSSDGRSLFVVATHHDAIVVMDTQTMAKRAEISVGAHPTHVGSCGGCNLELGDDLWVVNEDDDSISVIDMATLEVTDTIVDPTLAVPHSVRFAGGRAYVANIAGNQISIFDARDHARVDLLLAPNIDQPGYCSGDPCGYADAQIDANGILVAAHIESGNVLMYDTKTQTRVADLQVGRVPWAVFVDPFASINPTQLMANWGDASVSIFDGAAGLELARAYNGDAESYGINFSPLAPDSAYVLNRQAHSISVIDRRSGDLQATIDVGGTTETASTTVDGQYLLVPVSSADALAVVDVESNQVAHYFAGLGSGPWSVTTLAGQNYCH